jgi:class 3 adenylate cyclase
MHREFRRLLEGAKGVSEFPIALNVDIRGFSKWSGDSAESGLFIKKVYIRLIDEFFQDASFYKATGDGLLVIFPVNENDPQTSVRNIVSRSLKIVEKFASLTADDPMINFKTPGAVGIGLARGPASRLVSGRRTLDYSGATLNLASRLMDLARPKGVILDGQFGFDLLTPSVAKKFKSERVYLKGVAPNSGSNIYYTSDWTEIPASAKQPLDVNKWGEGVFKALRKEADEIHGNRIIYLNSHPKNSDELRCYVIHDAPTKSGQRSKKDWVSLDLPSSAFNFEETSKGPTVKVEMAAVHRALEKLGAGPSFPVEVRVEFVAE